MTTTDVTVEKGARRVRRAPYVSQVDELQEIVDAIKAEGGFAFDVETRGNIHRNSDVMAEVEKEWKSKEASLKSDHPTVLKRSRAAIEERWEKNMALDPLRNEVFWIGIAVTGRSWAIPMGHPNGEVLVPEERGDGTTIPPEGYRSILKSGKESMARAPYFIPATFTDPPEQLTQEQVFGALEEVFMDPSIAKINQNVKFDCKSIAKYYGGNLPEGRYIDTQVLMHIVDENLLNYALGTIIKRAYQGHDPYHAAGKLGAVISTKPFSEAAQYVHLDARWAWMMYKRLSRAITKDPKLTDVMFLDLDCIRPVAQMEMNGIQVNKRQMVNLGKLLELDINRLMMDVSQYAFPGFNIDSVQDKQKLLFNEKNDTPPGLGLSPVKRSEKTDAPSVDEFTLQKLQGKHPVPKLLMEYAEVKKLKSTYVDGMEPLLHNGRIHPQFHFHRTTTGRFSSCVSGRTLLHTNRGSFRFDEYIPLPGDEVVTHTGEWKPVLSKQYKGTCHMVSVHLDNGNMLECTLDHRVLTPNGWTKVRDLWKGSEVYSYVSEPELSQQSRERVERTEAVLGGWEWLSDEEGRWEIRLRAQASVRTGTGVGQVATVAGRASHRRGQDEQQSGQPSPGHKVGAWEASCEVAAVTKIAPLGTMGVWDVTVADDHSYCTSGFLNHNSDPNLQNIPRDERVRRLFEAEPGNSLIVADYSQIEMRIMAMYSQDPELLRIFSENIDVHTGTAQVILGRDPVDSEERNIFGKTPNFLMGYGGGPQRLVDATEGKIDLATAKKIVEGYNSGYAGLTKWKNKEIRKAQKLGYVETMRGRRRRLPDLSADGSTKEGWAARSKAERQAINAIVQGTAAEFMKEALIKLDAALDYPKCRMLVQVHDEVVISVPTIEVVKWEPIVEKCMGNGNVINGVAIEVEAHHAGSWAEAKG